MAVSTRALTGRAAATCSFAGAAIRRSIGTYHCRFSLLPPLPFFYGRGSVSGRFPFASPSLFAGEDQGSAFVSAQCPMPPRSNGTDDFANDSRRIFLKRRPAVQYYTTVRRLQFVKPGAGHVHLAFFFSHAQSIGGERKKKGGTIPADSSRLIATWRFCPKPNVHRPFHRRRSPASVS